MLPGFLPIELTRYMSCTGCTPIPRPELQKQLYTLNSLAEVSGALLAQNCRNRHWLAARPLHTCPGASACSAAVAQPEHSPVLLLVQERRSGGLEVLVGVAGLHAARRKAQGKQPPARRPLPGTENRTDCVEKTRSWKVGSWNMCHVCQLEWPGGVGSLLGLA
jgi:hypothetical protein